MMDWLKKLAISIAVATTIIGGAALVAQAGSPVTTASAQQDVSGPCDEAEHANDPQCGGTSTTIGEDENDDNSVTSTTLVDGDDDGGATSTTLVNGDDDGGDDISGPCDEAEHANDPACAGTSTTFGDNDDNDDGVSSDNSGPGSMNSGPGSTDDDDSDDNDSDDNSGPGSHDSDDDDSDDSGSGSDDSGDNSGSGSGSGSDD
jgi:hypothetical protein